MTTKNKLLSVVSAGGTMAGSVAGAVSHIPGTVQVSCQQENWNLLVQCQEDFDKDCELAEITIKLHNGTTWKGTIQDFAAVQQYAANALAQLRDFATHMEPFPNTKGAYIEGINESQQEIETLLSHFRKADELVSELAEIGLLRSKLKIISSDLDRFTCPANARERLDAARDQISDAIININLALQEML